MAGKNTFLDLFLIILICDLPLIGIRTFNSEAKDYATIFCASYSSKLHNICLRRCGIGSGGVTGEAVETIDYYLNSKGRIGSKFSEYGLAVNNRAYQLITICVRTNDRELILVDVAINHNCQSAIFCAFQDDSFYRLQIIVFVEEESASQQA